MPLRRTGTSFLRFHLPEGPLPVQLYLHVGDRDPWWVICHQRERIRLPGDIFGSVLVPGRGLHAFFLGAQFTFQFQRSALCHRGGLALRNQFLLSLVNEGRDRRVEISGCRSPQLAVQIVLLLLKKYASTVLIIITVPLILFLSCLLLLLL